MISPAWRLQSRQLSYTVTCRLKSPKPYILSDREPGGSQITFHDLAWKSQNTISPTLLAEADTKLHLISGEKTSSSPSNGEVASLYYKKSEMGYIVQLSLENILLEVLRLGDEPLFPGIDELSHVL